MPPRTLSVAILLALAVNVVATARPAAAETPSPDAAPIETPQQGEERSASAAAGDNALGCVCGSAMESAMRGPIGVVVPVLLGVLLIPVVSTLIALTLFLVRRSRVPARGPVA